MEFGAGAASDELRYCRCRPRLVVVRGRSVEIRNSSSPDSVMMVARTCGLTTQYCQP